MSNPVTAEHRRRAQQQFRCFHFHVGELARMFADRDADKAENKRLQAIVFKALADLAETEGCFDEAQQTLVEKIDEIKRLQAILAELPQTLDGVLIQHGMKVYEPVNLPWSTTPWPARVMYHPTATDRPFLLAGPARDDFNPAECFSTKEAAEAANSEKE